ncbi:EpsG family protein [Peptoclostridium litorale]|uniref:EpsG family protein n=1 Tax=Peptoclostridium litorale TaxID=1557 RepID=UPI00135642F2|nr:EpsG family protein [Peptoclostridium litorale]
MIFVILIYGLFEKKKSRIALPSISTVKTKRYLNVNNLFLLLIFTLMFILIAFRGDFSADYINYETHYQIAKKISWNNIFRNGLRVGGAGDVEFGFYVLMKTIGTFTSNSIWLFSIVALLTIYPIYISVRDESEIQWLSMLLFIVFGSFISSFNVIRAILAYSILFYNRQYIYDKRYFRYVVIILLSSFIHSSSLLMIVVVLLDMLRLNNKIYIFLWLPLSLIIFIFSHKLILLADGILYDSFFSEIYQHGISKVSYGNIIAPALLGIFFIVGSLLINNDDRKYKIGLITTSLWIFFRISMINFSLMRRFADMMSLYMIIFLPYMITRLPLGKSIKLTTKIVLAMATIALFYYTMKDSPYNSYYFIWDR